MKDLKSLPLIDIDALRIGMFVHLDVSWMAHPFPLSSFKISAQDQINTLRDLGLQQVRWNPQNSDVGPIENGPIEASDPLPRPKMPAAAVSAPTSAEAVAQAQRQRKEEALSAQRAALNVCERHFAEATRGCRAMIERVAVAPVEARGMAQDLSRHLLTQVAVSGDLSIRLLSAAAGDKASAHAVNVTLISLLMGRTFGWSDADMFDLSMGALLHDVGKLDLPDRVRHRQEHFTPNETRFYEEHVNYGVVCGRKMALSPGALLVIAQHHEMADGSGFPSRVNSDRMTPAARVVALVNRYDNLCNPNVPSHAMTPHEAVSMLFAQGKNKFDTTILGAFIKMMGVYPPGSLVQLTDDRYAMVVSVNSSRPLKPKVMVYERRVPRDEALTLDLEQQSGLGIRRSLKPVALPPDALVYLSPRQRVAYFFEPVGIPPEGQTALGRELEPA